MKLTCQQKDFFEALTLVQKAINPQNTLPILGNVLLKAEGQKLYLSATNLEIAITTSISADIKNEGKITIPAKILVSYVGYLKEGEIKLVLEDGETIFIQAVGSKTKLKGISPEEFPVIPVVEKEEYFSVSSEALKKSIEEVVFCCAGTTTRPVLSGVYFWGKDTTLHLVATDSYRLGEKKITLSGKNSIKDLKNIIPSRTMQELVRILGSSKEKEVEVISSKNQILFQIGTTKLISRLIEGKFPEYTQIIPSSYKIKAKISRDELILGIKRVGLFARENNNNIKVSFKKTGSVELTTDATEIGSEESEIAAEVSGENTEVALNGQYLLDVLQSIDTKTVYIQTEEKLSPVVIKPEKEEDYVHVIMPLKI
ncbi:DNA polymerase III subunit beta [Candidatus Peregrinibacteria bacterium]|nr:DNA polymerase III subunit beta [Candidatus Peregrinibacteria bacterium]